MDFSLPEDTVMLRDVLQRFIEKEARPLEMKYFTTGHLEPTEQEHLRNSIEQLGLWGITVPEAYGGFGLDMITACVVMEELGQTFIPVEIGEVPPMLYACRDEQVTRFLEPALNGERRVFIAGREPKAVTPETWQTEVLVEEESYLLNGHKLLSTAPNSQDFLIVLVHMADGLTAFLIDADYAGLTWSVNGTVILHLQNCRLNADDILGERGQALRAGMDEAGRNCIRLGARHVGLAERLLEMATSYAKEWVSLGAPLSERPAIQGLIADLRVRIESVRWLVYHSAWRVDQGEPLHEPAAQVRLATGTMLQEAVDLATMMYGGPSPAPQLELQRFIESKLPSVVTQLGLTYARTAVAHDMLAKVGA